MGQPQGLTEGTTCGDLDGLFLGACLGSLYGIEIGKNIGNELEFFDGKVICTTLRALDGISIGTYGVTVLRSLEVSTEVIAEVKFQGFLIGAWIGSLDIIERGTDDGNILLL